MWAERGNAMTPTFTWHPPNIRALPGAVWQHRDRVPGCQDCAKAGWVRSYSGNGDPSPVCANPDSSHGGEWSEPTARTDVPKKRVVSAQGYGPMVAEFHFPPAHGDAFYRTLQTLGYRKNAAGDYV